MHLPVDERAAGAHPQHRRVDGTPQHPAGTRAHTHAGETGKKLLRNPGTAINSSNIPAFAGSSCTRRDSADTLLFASAEFCAAALQYNGNAPRQPPQLECPDLNPHLGVEHPCQLFLA
jgi:hypothetical protein